MHYLLGCTAGEQAGEAGSAMSPHDDEIAVMLLSHAQNLLGRVASGKKIPDGDSCGSRNALLQITLKSPTIRGRLQLGCGLAVGDVFRTKRFRHMEDEDFCVMEASQIGRDLQGVSGTFREIGRMQDDLRMEHNGLLFQYIA